MNRSICLILALVTACLLQACGSAPASNAAANAPGPKSNANASGVVVDNSNTPSNVSIANQQIPGITGPANAAPPDPNAPSGGDLAMANKRRIVDVPGPPPSGPPPSIPAPDNSAMTTAMAPDGSFVESRVFTGDKDISKLERTSNGKAQSVKIFLKSGRVVSVSPSKVAAINSVPLAAIKALAGIKAPPAPKLSLQEIQELKKKQETQ